MPFAKTARELVPVSALGGSTKLTDETVFAATDIVLGFEVRA
jgi:hypothetical protein